MYRVAGATGARSFLWCRRLLGAWYEAAEEAAERAEERAREARSLAESACLDRLPR